MSHNNFYIYRKQIKTCQYAINVKRWVQPVPLTPASCLLRACFPSDYSLRNGLLIFFLLVLPLLVLLVLVLLYVFRRDTLNPCLKGNLTSRLK